MTGPRISRRELIAAGTFVAATPAWATTAQDGSARLNAFFESVFQRDLQRNPGAQSTMGMKAGQDRWPDVSAARADENVTLVRRDLAELRRFDRGALTPEARLSWDLFAYNAEEAIERHRWRGNHYPVCQMRGPQRDIPQTLVNNHAIESAADAEAYVARLHAVRPYLAAVVAGLARQAANGVVPPAFAVPLVIGNCEKLITGAPFQPGTPDSPILADFRGKVAKLDVPDGARARLMKAAEAGLVEGFGPGFRHLVDHLRARPCGANCSEGVWRLPGGDIYYAAQLRWNTTLPVAPEEVHRIGLDETARLHGEMRAVMQRAGFSGSLPELFAHVRAADRFYYPDTAEGKAAYLDAMRAKIAAVTARLGELTNHVPGAGVVVKPVEPWLEASAGTAGYFAPSADGTRPGILYVNTRDMRNLPIFELSALSYHEGVPGHHLEKAVTRALTGLPKFRAFGGYTAFSEGWALFAEQLPLDMGLYDDPWQEFGRLSMELMRAGRLVTDTGVHALRWSREKAVRWLDENTPSNHADHITAIQRYIVTPGQACAYEMGKLKLVELRDRARAKLGGGFDLRRFNDRVLGSGPLPLPMLEAQIDAWIAAGGAA
ncbi:hypothetical protein ASE06_07275 [Sphingopyxis sp. Root214]|uniref:DUF885 domain-containing protein n=1 Tax=unclassified Sphingopyxis TaxID=2614943 RepID=UPI0006F29C74|nr:MULTISPECIES: DUF885 domain-containing protein [unclassified Sphingopyxis]KQZ76482.1 hypothetical protein ASD73_00720 [Sphingopyxis sp. Root154]KRC09631.1 hypothetical protein ASE06_07275 [Sphingopyxis sp. Root214]